MTSSAHRICVYSVNKSHDRTREKLQQFIDIVQRDPAVDTVEMDVLVLGDDRDAVSRVQALAGRIAGVRGVYAGRLRNAGQVEALTANLVSINRRYKAHAGLRVTDI